MAVTFEHFDGVADELGFIIAAVGPTADEDDSIVVEFVSVFAHCSGENHDLDVVFEVFEHEHRHQITCTGVLALEVCDHPADGDELVAAVVATLAI